MTRYDCMTPEELALWEQANAYAPAVRPCTDCPAWFEAQAMAEGTCSRARPYESPTALTWTAERQRTYKRAWMREWRASQRALAVGE